MTESTPLTAEEIAAITKRAAASASVAGFTTIHAALAREDVPRLVTEIERQRAVIEAQVTASLSTDVLVAEIRRRGGHVITAPPATAPLRFTAAEILAASAGPPDDEKET